MITLGDYQYAQFDGSWYTVVGSLKGDLVDIRYLIVRLKDGEDISAFDFTAAQLPVFKNVRGRFAGSFYELEVPQDLDPFKVAKVLQATGSFDKVFFNVLAKVGDEWPNDEHYSSQWNLPKISMSQAWNSTTGDPAVIVAVIDVGADYNHEDLQANLWSGIGYDFLDNDSDPYPDDGAGHGTAMAGILGAVTHNVIGVAGVAGGNGVGGGIRIMHLDAGYRAASGDELVNIAAAAEATDSAAAWGAKVINMSFGTLDPRPDLEAAIDLAVANYGVVVVALAGNYTEGNATDMWYPARYSNVIAVGATTPSDTRKKLNDGTEDWW